MFIANPEIQFPLWSRRSPPAVAFELATDPSVLSFVKAGGGGVHAILFGFSFVLNKLFLIYVEFISAARMMASLAVPCAGGL